MRPAIVETPFRGATPEEGAANLEYLAEVMAFVYGWGWSPYASHDVIPRLNARGGPIDTADADVAARAKGLAAGDAWAERADLVVFGIDRGWSAGMKRRLTFTWPKGRVAPLREIVFVSRLKNSFVITQPDRADVGRVLGW